MKKTRTDLLNLICEIRKPQRYLEIGIKDGVNFMAVNCPEKVGVDPKPECRIKGVMKVTSDEAFRRLEGFQFDLIFIDGLHTWEQTDSDIDNAIWILNDGGLIVCHDALPHNKEYTNPQWCGTSYIAIMGWAQFSNIECITWEGDHGCAIFRVINRDSDYAKVPCTFENLWKNDAEIVNKSTWEEVEKWLKELK